jgi:membrane-associated phospholipid phosphatase
LALSWAGATVAAYEAKFPLQAFVQGAGGRGAYLVAEAINTCGSGLAMVLLGATALLAGRWWRKPALVDAVWVFAAAGLWCWLLTTLGQLVLSERRPRDGGAMLLLALGGHGVSGHASAAGLLFGPVRNVLARNAPARTRGLVTVALLVWAAWVGWSRVWLGMHFVWNVVLGLGIGFFTGLVGAGARQPTVQRPAP